jgi:hypothetical protein
MDGESGKKAIKNVSGANFSAMRSAKLWRGDKMIAIF